MYYKLTLVLLALVSTLVLVQQQPQAWAATSFQSVLPTPAPAAEGEAPSLADLAARVDALQAQVAELTTQLNADHHHPETALANHVATAIYLLDTVGLHDLDGRLNEEQDLQPGDAGTMTRIARLLTTVTWPAALATDAMSVTTTLNDLAVALSDDDLAAAAPLATLAHETGHDLSHAAEEWLGAQAILGEPGHSTGQAFRVASAVYLLDNAGFHDLDVRLNDEQDLQPGDAGHVERVARLLATVDWPEPLAMDVVTLTTVLNDLAAALSADDLETAAPLATTAHEVQHDFSHAAEHWLAGEMGGHSDADGADHHGEEETSNELTEEDHAPAESSGG